MIETKNNLTVAKSNKMVQQSKINLSLLEQRIINYMIAGLKPDDVNFSYIKLSYKEFCEISNLKYTSNFAYIRQIIKKLYDKSWEVFDGEHYVPVRWLEDYQVNENEVLLKFHFRMQEYLLNLKNNFTQAELNVYFSFKNKYSPILYDYFKSWVNIVVRNRTLDNFERVLTVDELRDKLGLNIPNSKGNIKYPLFKDLRVNILEPCLFEINNITDITVEYEAIKKSRKVDRVKFIIKPRNVLERIGVKTNE